MIRAPSSDFWQVGIVPRALQSWISATPPAIPADEIRWLPDPGAWRYLADPFAVRRGHTTHVFVEAYDYRTKHAIIERHEFGADLTWQGAEPALKRPFHLSYPFLVEDRGEVFMIPESHRAGEVALYRAERFPQHWIRETVLLEGTPGAETSVIRHEGRWWMFFTIVGPKARDQRELHVAFADQLTGPWQRHPLNPILDDRTGARPGGTPFVDASGAVVLPVQDCSETYGGAIRLLRFTCLDVNAITCEHLPERLVGGHFSSTHEAGCHTLSGCGDLTLFDVKKVVRSRTRHLIDWQRRLTRFFS